MPGGIERIWPAFRAFSYNLTVSRKCGKLPHVPPMVERSTDIVRVSHTEVGPMLDTTRHF